MASKEFYIKVFFSSKSSFDVRSQYQNNSYIHPFHIFFRTERPKTNFWFSKICYKKQFPDNKINLKYLPILHFAPKEKCFCSQSVTSWHFLNYLNLNSDWLCLWMGSKYSVVTHVLWQFTIYQNFII